MSSTIKFKSKVDTKSNLKSDVLRELCEIFEFDFSKFERIKSQIDQLVHIRNAIAHGENSIPVDIEQVNNYIATVTTGMDILFIEINDFLEAEKYLL